MWELVYFLLINVILPAAIATGIALLMYKAPKRAKPAGKDAFQLPTAEEGRPLPLLSGKRRILSPNAISPLLELYAQHSGSSTRPNTYYYHVGLQLGLCLANIDGVLQFWMAETCLWPTLNDPSVEAADGQTIANVQAVNCWGGYNREGGAKGHVQIQYGDVLQTLNDFLEYKLGSDQPAYRGITTLILGSMTSQTVHGLFYIGTMPVIKPISVLAKRTDKHIDGSEMWYLDKANVGDDDLNAIHFLYERLFCKVGGLGKDISLLGDSWTAAADTCYTEGYGLSNVWDWSPDDIESMIHQVEEIIDGKIYIDPATGKFEIGLVRADYDPDDPSIESFGPADFWVENMPTSSPGTVPSKIIVKWHDKVNLQERPAFDDDIALLARQGGNPIVYEVDYSAFVCNGPLATKIACRSQHIFSAMPKRYTLHALRTMSHLHETSIFKMLYPALNVTSMIVRVISIDRGSLTEGDCIIDVAEDVFGQAHTVYASPYGAPPSSGATPAEEELEEIGQDELVIDRLSSEVVIDRLSLDQVYRRATDPLS